MLAAGGKCQSEENLLERPDKVDFWKRPGVLAALEPCPVGHRSPRFGQGALLTSPRSIFGFVQTAEYSPSPDCQCPTSPSNRPNVIRIRHPELQPSLARGYPASPSPRRSVRFVEWKPVGPVWLGLHAWGDLRALGWKILAEARFARWGRRILNTIAFFAS
jgi:hypothetical protein